MTYHCLDSQKRIYVNAIDIGVEDIDEDSGSEGNDSHDEDIGEWLPADEAGIKDGDLDGTASLHVTNPLYSLASVKATANFRKHMVMLYPILHTYHPQLSGPFNSASVVPHNACTNRYACFLM